MFARRFLLIVLVFLIPVVCYGLLEERLYNEVISEWNKHTELIDQFNKLNPSEMEGSIQLLTQACECCRKALSNCEAILKSIDSKSKKQKKEDKWVDFKQRCEKDKGNISKEIEQIQQGIQNLQFNFAFAKAKVLYETSVEKASYANEICQNCQRTLNNVDEVISVFSNAALLYEEAASIAEQAFNLINPFPDQENKNVIKQTIDNFKALSNKFKEEIHSWPDKIALQKADIEKQILKIKEECDLFDAKGLQRNSYELQKQAVSLLEQLIESSEGQKKQEYETARDQLLNQIAEFEKKVDENRLTDCSSAVSLNDFKTLEEQRKLFFLKKIHFFRTYF